LSAAELPDMLLRQAEAALAAGRLGDGLRNGEAAWAASAAHDDAWRLRCGSALIKLRYRSGAQASVVELGREVLPLSRALALPAAERAELLRLVALAAAETGGFEQAMTLGHEAHRIADEAGDRALMALAINVIGWVYHRIGDPWHSEQLLLSALELAREAGAEQPIFFVLNNLAGVLLGSYYLQQDTTARPELGPLLERALGYARECARLAQAQTDAFARATVLCNLGEVLVLRGEHAEAAGVLGPALALAEVAGFNALQWRIGANLGRLELQRGQPAAALALLEPVLQACEAARAHNTQLRVQHVLWLCHSALGDSAGALGHLERYHRMEHERLLNQLRGRSQLFVTRVEAEQARLETLRERERAHRAEADARIDQLTRLGNRRALEERWPPLVEKTQMAADALTLAMLDLDHFKRINDRFGHAVGDSVLVALAELLRQNLRSHDLIIRVGGEEFLVVLPETGLARAEEICARLRERVEQHAWCAVAEGLALTVSIGLAAAPPYELGLLLARADAALYAAKAAGRNRVCCAQ